MILILKLNNDKQINQENILILFLWIKEISKYQITFSSPIPSLSYWPHLSPTDRTQGSIFWPFKTFDFAGINLSKMLEPHLLRQESGIFVFHKLKTYPGRKCFFFSSLFYLLPDVLFAALFDFAIGFDFDPDALLGGCLDFAALLGDLAAGLGAGFLGVFFLAGFLTDSS